VTPRRYLPVACLALAVVLLQVVLSLVGQPYLLSQLTMSAYYGLVVVGLCLLMGYAGQISIGHAAFFAIGGYTNAVLTTLNLAPFQAAPLVRFLSSVGMLVRDTDLYGGVLLHVSPWLALAAGLLLAAGVAFVIGIPILKLKGHYLAMATLAFGIIIGKILIANPALGSADGISSVPAFVILPGLSVCGDASARIQNYYIAWAVLIGVMLLLLNLINSRPGRALRAIHGNEEAAGSVGIDTARYKLAIFVLSAVLAALGGALLTYYNGGIGPSEAGVTKSVRYVAMVAIGGMANLWGALIMGVGLEFISLRGYLGTFDEAFFGLVMILIIMFFPDGLFHRQSWKRLTLPSLFPRRGKKGRP
jgi:branched-chain amino acid transport system permease protein